jgi:hypothetical protein
MVCHLRARAVFNHLAPESVYGRLGYEARRVDYLAWTTAIAIHSTETCTRRLTSSTPGQEYQPPMPYYRLVRRKTQAEQD